MLTLAGDFASGGFDFFFGGFAGERGERAGEDEGETFEGGAADAFFGDEVKSGGAEAFDEGEIFLVAEELVDGLGDLGADVVDTG